MGVEIVMIRHGESEWSQKNLFCGWYDANLSQKGVEEAKEAGRVLKEKGYQFDLAYTSLLTRAQKTLDIILQIIGQPEIPVFKTWRINERHYGNLTGLDKQQTAAKYGKDQVQLWRRSYDVPPPPITEENPYYKIIMEDPRYKTADGPQGNEFPKVEYLKKTIERTLPYWDKVIVPQIKDGKRILIVAHGNSLRGLIKHLDKISDDEIMELNVPTGIPFVYELDERLNPVVSMKYMADAETVKIGVEAAASITRGK